MKKGQVGVPVVAPVSIAVMDFYHVLGHET
jgi:hypothetical protein